MWVMVVARAARGARESSDTDFFSNMTCDEMYSLVLRSDKIGQYWKETLVTEVCQKCAEMCLDREKNETRNLKLGH